jgi:hypothetical protein
MRRVKVRHALALLRDPGILHQPDNDPLPG